MRSRHQNITGLGGGAGLPEADGATATARRARGPAVAGALALLFLVVAPAACASGAVPMAPEEELHAGSTGSAPLLAQCADARPPRGEGASVRAECSGGGAGTYACQSGMSCRNYTILPNSRLSREPDEISCSTATRLCTAVYYGGGGTTFNPEEQGFLFGSSCFAACGNAALTRSPFTLGTCMVCAGLYARHYDVVGDAARVSYVLGMHGMNPRRPG